MPRPNLFPVLLAGLLVTPSGHAETPARAAGSNPAAAACRPDVRRLCSAISPGSGRLRQCLAEHREQLSPDCRKAFAEAVPGSAGGRAGTGR